MANTPNIEEYKGVYVFAEQVDGVIGGIAFELLGKAKDLAADLGQDVTAVLIGSGIKDKADSLAEYGADHVIVIDDPSDLSCFLLKYPYEFLSYYLALLFRLRNSRKLAVISLLSIDPYKVKIETSVLTEYFFYFVSFIFTKESVVHKHTGKLVSYRF